MQVFLHCWDRFAVILLPCLKGHVRYKKSLMTEIFKTDGSWMKCSTGLTILRKFVWNLDCLYEEPWHLKKQLPLFSLCMLIVYRQQKCTIFFLLSFRSIWDNFRLCRTWPLLQLLASYCILYFVPSIILFGGRNNLDMACLFLGLIVTPNILFWFPSMNSCT